MLSKSFTASIFLLALTSSVNADCIITPALGISGIPAAGDVQLKLLQKPSDTVPCGNASFIQYLDSSEPIKADQSGQFTPSITNYDTGDSGSRLIQTVKVDQTGTGEHFADAQMVANGDQNPTSEGTQQLTVKLPDGIKCAGGSGKNRCLASFVTASGHGNCVVVTQAETTEKSSTSTDGGKAQTNALNGDHTKQDQNTGGDKPKHNKRMFRKSRL